MQDHWSRSTLSFAVQADLNIGHGGYKKEFLETHQQIRTRSIYPIGQSKAVFSKYFKVLRGKIRASYLHNNGIVREVAWQGARGTVHWLGTLASLKEG